MKRNAKWEKVGTIPVDSGQVMLVDPCYLHNWVAGEFDGDRDPKATPLNHYEEACRVTLSDAGAGPCFGYLTPGNDAACAFATRTAYGDGEYRVFVLRDEDGTIHGLKVLFG